MNNLLIDNLLCKIGHSPTTIGKNNISEFNSWQEWLLDQLHNPFSYDDQHIENLFSKYETTLKNNFELSLKYNSNPPPSQKQIIDESFNRRVYYAIYSENRIREMMVWFWFNHFNVYGDSGAFVYLKSYEDIFRNNPFGKFKDILWEVCHNPAMLTYLDNDVNTKPMNIHDTDIGISDNYPRMLLDLHTLGFDGGHTEEDIYQLALILSGFKAIEEYNFFCSDESDIYLDELKKLKSREDVEHYLSENKSFDVTKVYRDYGIFFEHCHVPGDKTFLGKIIKSNSLNELDEAIEILAQNPKTANNICSKLILFFLGDGSYSALQKEMVATYLKTDGSIKDVLISLLLSKNFEDNITTKKIFKNPHDYYISSFKMLLNGQHITNLEPIQSLLFDANFPIHWKVTPEGYDLNTKTYLTPNTLHQYINFSQLIISSTLFNNPIDFNKSYYKLQDIELTKFLLSKDWLYK